MRHPKRRLSEYLDGELPESRRPALEAHLGHCSRCRREFDEQSALRNRLQTLLPPPLDSQLQQRILSAPRQQSVRRPPSQPSWLVAPQFSGGMDSDDDFRGRTHGRHPLLAVSAAGTLAAVSVFAGAYLLGGEPEPAPAPRAAASLAAEWSAAGSGDRALLGEDDLLGLRSAGWNCPQLRGLGFGLVKASGHTIAGQPTVRLELSDGNRTVVVYEQRNDTPAQLPEIADGGGTQPLPSPAPQERVPVSAVSGAPVDAGYTLRSAGGHPYWLRSGATWEAVVPTNSADYTVTSDLPAEQADATVGQLIQTHESRVRPWHPEPSDRVPDRILRGFGRILQPGGNW